jgi:hypothetical protein
MFIGRRTTEQITPTTTFDQIKTAFALAHAVNFALLAMTGMALIALPGWLSLMAVCVAGVALVTVALYAMRAKFAQWRDGTLRIERNVALRVLRDGIRLCAGVALCVAFITAVARGWWPHSVRVCGAQLCITARNPWAVGMLRAAFWAVAVTMLATWRFYFGAMWALWMELTMPQLRESLLIRAGITPDGISSPPFSTLHSPERSGGETVVITEDAPAPAPRYDQGGGDE